MLQDARNLRVYEFTDMQGRRRVGIKAQELPASWQEIAREEVRSPVVAADGTRLESFYIVDYSVIPIANHVRLTEVERHVPAVERQLQDVQEQLRRLTVRVCVFLGVRLGVVVKRAEL